MSRKGHQLFVGDGFRGGEQAGTADGNAMHGDWLWESLEMVGTGQIQCRADYAPGLAGPEVG